MDVIFKVMGSYFKVKDNFFLKMRFSSGGIPTGSLLLKMSTFVTNRGC